MQDFEFCSYTRFIFGRDSEKSVGKVLKEEGANTVMVVHDPGRFLYDSGLLNNINESLSNSGLKILELGNVKPNPLISYAEEGIKAARENNVDYLLAVGGGSVIDTAKSISAGITYDGPLWDLFEGNGGKTDPSKKIPVAVILTNPATGSESGYGCMMDNNELQIKGALTSAGNWLRPEICFMNPELTFSLPASISGTSIVDMYSHIAERYFCNTPEIGVIDYMSEAAMRYLVENGHKVIEEPADYETRANIMWVGSIAHNDTLGVGRKKDMASHDIGHVLSALYDTPHGNTISIIMPSWMRHIYKNDLPRFVRYAKEVFGIENTGPDDENAAFAGIEATQEWFEYMGCPTGFSAGRIPTEDVERIVNKAVKPNGRPTGRCYFLYHDDVEAIVKDAASR